MVLWISNLLKQRVFGIALNDSVFRLTERRRFRNNQPRKVRDAKTQANSISSRSQRDYYTLVKESIGYMTKALQVTLEGHRKAPKLSQVCGSAAAHSGKAMPYRSDPPKKSGGSASAHRKPEA
jgi:hypothetical protein